MASAVEMRASRPGKRLVGFACVWKKRAAGPAGSARLAGRTRSGLLKSYPVLVSDFDYELPPERIATVGVEPRDSARLMVALDSGVEDRTGGELDQFRRAGDVLVVNNTRVLPARIRFQRPTGGSA